MKGFLTKSKYIYMIAMFFTILIKKINSDRSDATLSMEVDPISLSKKGKAKFQDEHLLA